MILEERKKRRRKKPFDSEIYTTGDPMLNMAFFNKCMGTDCLDDEDDKEANKAADKAGNELAGGTTGEGSAGSEGDASAEGDAGSEGFGEALKEAKREVRRYYIRPQNIFCSNKAEVLRALIDVGNNNCSVYTLKNLEDNDDIHKLTSHDIIYYYDDGILYDKNKVRVMDYDLYIKHEEERKKFSGNPENVSDAEFNREYADRVTDRATGLDEGIKMNESLTKKEFLEKIGQDDIYLGYTVEADNIFGFSDGGVYSNTDYWASTTQDGKALLLTFYVSDDGAEKEKDNILFNTPEELYDYVIGLNLEDCQLKDDELFEEAFNCDFVGINAFNEKVSPSFTCCICGEKFDGYGHNPQPYKKSGTCCDACNSKFVIPARLAEYQAEYDLDDNLDPEEDR